MSDFVSCPRCGGKNFVEVQDFYEDGSPARSVSIEPCACQIENIQHRPAGSVGAVHRSNADIAEISRLTARIAELEKALGWFLSDDRFRVAVGGSPHVVEKMIADARTTLEASERGENP